MNGIAYDAHRQRAHDALDELLDTAGPVALAMDADEVDTTVGLELHTYSTERVVAGDDREICAGRSGGNAQWSRTVNTYIGDGE